MNAPRTSGPGRHVGRVFVGHERAVRDLLSAIFLRPSTGPKRCPRCDRGLPNAGPTCAFTVEQARPDGLCAICVDCQEVAQARYWLALHPAKKAAKRARETWKQRMARPGARAKDQERQSEYARLEVAVAGIARGATVNLAAGLTVDGRRSWVRPDRRAQA